jgi:hypothetical protein
MAKDFSICDLPENVLLRIFDSFIKEHKDKDYTELARMLGIPPKKMDTFRQLIDDLQVHNAKPSNKYVPKPPPPKEPISSKAIRPKLVKRG